MADKKLTPPTSMVDLKPAPYNPRKIDKASAAGLGKSLDVFGDISGITWNARTGHLVAGHQRVAQLRKRGASLITLGGVPTIVVNDRNGDIIQSFPVRVVDWDEGFEKGANIEANNKRIAGDFTKDLGGVLADVQKGMSEVEFEELRFDDLERDVLKASRDLSEHSDDAEFTAEYHVMVTCKDEVEQTKLLERMESEGYKVRALMA